MFNLHEGSRQSRRKKNTLTQANSSYLLKMCYFGLLPGTRRGRGCISWWLLSHIAASCCRLRKQVLGTNGNQLSVQSGCMMSLRAWALTQAPGVFGTASNRRPLQGPNTQSKHVTNTLSWPEHEGRELGPDGCSSINCKTECLFKDNVRRSSSISQDFLLLKLNGVFIFFYGANTEAVGHPKCLRCYFYNDILKLGLSQSITTQTCSCHKSLSCFSGNQT